MEKVDILLSVHNNDNYLAELLDSLLAQTCEHWRALIRLDGSTDRSRRIIETRWLTEDKLTLHDLADEYGVSAERIRQIEANAIKKMRAAMEV